MSVESGLAIFETGRVTRRESHQEKLNVSF